MTRDDICSAFLDRLSVSPYPFQEEALLAWFSDAEGVLVTAPTGMGKTLIAEAAIYEALTTRKRLYYTTPLIALTDQKFREFQGKAEAWGFSRDDVGLITGNRKVNPNAVVRVVVAEILLNHLLSGEENFDEVSGVVMDEFHYFNDFERGTVWELSLVLLPRNVRLMLLSATVGNAPEFVSWLKKEHGRSVALVRTDERRVPLEYVWVGDKLLTELLPEMVTGDDATQRSPALVFCFNRDECWEIAEVMKGLALVGAEARAQIEASLPAEEFSDGVGPKLRQMLIRGVGVHHAGVLPKYKELIEDLFLRKLVPFVICTETLAAGINLPARSVVLSTLLKGPPRERKLIFPSAAHQMFGRAGRPQFDKKGYVYAVAHEDDARIAKWKKKYDQIDPKSKDPGILRAKKDLERKRPTRRTNEQYWTEGQFKTLIAAGPGKLASRSMIPYQVLVFLLRRDASLSRVREFLGKRFNTPDQIESFQRQLDHMIGNLAAMGFVELDADAAHVRLTDRIAELALFRSIDPLYAVFLCGMLNTADFTEKLLALESVLPLPPSIERTIFPPEDLPPGPLETNELRPLMIQLGVIVAGMAPKEDVEEERRGHAMWEDEPPPRPPVFAEMLKLAFDAKLPSPEDILVQPKWAAGGVFTLENSFFKYIKNRGLEKQEGLILRHLLRLVILAGEFKEKTQDPHYAEIADRATRAAQQVDPRYTDRFLAEAVQAKALAITPT
ncbi:MAG: DEAD/DEAH box helicase [Phycisphaerae bacterium]|nr:MAG: DEAD/DEAH box helicase [Planctomycetota bacterium]MBE7457483.1 DEAD/DEAH box helicase [Planctomycetia bacterium]MCK6464523.1 DEAD/DEAH box helicase [Phycisphaerae bacterium]MCL4718859.1 DEAD/DEAH box helicase [Phycisphaerae bacterium]MCQ3921707.1 helicase [Planctomycetota bacterium]